MRWIILIGLLLTLGLCFGQVPRGKMPAYHANLTKVAAAGGGTDSPDDIGTLAAWWKADALSLSDNDPVTTWTDSSGNGRSITNSGTTRPTYKTAIVNSLPVVRFDNTDDYLQRTETLSFTAAEVFVVMKLDNDPPSDVSFSGLWDFSGDTANSHFPYPVDDIIYDGWGTNARKTAGDPAPSLSSVFRLINIASASGEWTLRIDGTQVYTTASNTVGWPATVILLGKSNGAFYFDGDIAEVFIFSAVLSAGDRDSMEAYADSKYNLSY